MPQKIILDPDQLRSLHAAGLSDNEIAKRMDATRPTVARNRVELGLPAQDKYKQASEAGKKGGKSTQRGVAERLARQQEIARTMHAEGKARKEIAAALNVSTSRAAQILRSIGIRTARTAPRPEQNFRVSMQPASAPNNGAALRRVRIGIIRDTWARVVARQTA
jgi:DNA-binding CsgD family transcriptional regulator